MKAQFDQILNQFKQKNYLVLLILLSFLVRLAIFVFVATHTERAFKVDSYYYDRIAQNVVKFHTFSGGVGKDANLFRLSFAHESGVSGTKLIPDSVRTPLYPGFLALIYGIVGRKILIVIFLQIIISLVTSIIVYKIGKTTFNETVGIIAFILISLDLGLLAYPNHVLTDMLFVFLITVFVWFFVHFLSTDKILYILLSASFLGLSVLCKPVPQYLSLALIPILLGKYKRNLKRFLVYSFVYIGVFLLVISPWLIRNYVVFGYAKLSSIPGYDLFLHRVAFLEGEKKGGDYAEYEATRTRLVGELQQIIDDQQLNSLEASIIAEKLGKQRILAEPWIYLRSHAKGMIRMFIGHNLRALYSIITDKPYQSGSALSLLYETGSIKTALSAIFDASNFIAFMVLSIVFVRAVLYGFLLYGCYKALRTRPLFLALFLLIIAYFVSVTGPYGITPRYRVYIAPFIIILSSYGIVECLKKRERVSL